MAYWRIVRKNVNGGALEIEFAVWRSRDDALAGKPPLLRDDIATNYHQLLRQTVRPLIERHFNGETYWRRSDTGEWATVRQFTRPDTGLIAQGIGPARGPERAALTLDQFRERVRRGIRRAALMHRSSVADGKTLDKRSRHILLRPQRDDLVPDDVRQMSSEDTEADL